MFEASIPAWPPPMTIISKFIYLIQENVFATMVNVSRETIGRLF
jgi:hypothetical protein